MDFSKLYINGTWVPSHGTETIDVENPYTKTIITSVPAGDEQDVEDAVKAARNAFPLWRDTPLHRRIQLMERFLSIMKDMLPSLVQLEVEELGAPISFAQVAHGTYQLERIQSYIDLAPQVPLVEYLEASTVTREPIGVIACITPWNYPLGQAVQKVIPAILMGNTVILKPAQLTPLTCYMMAQAFHEAGFPAGVFNLLVGRGRQVGEMLCHHRGVNMISFTGSTAAGIHISIQGAYTLKRVTTELGGKSPCVALAGAPVDDVVRATYNSVFLNSGQTCTALSRLIIPKSEQAQYEEALVRIAKEYTVGDPNDPTVKVGPLASTEQYKSVWSYMDDANWYKVRLLVGGDVDPEHNIIAPTVYMDVPKKRHIWTDEVFGPVLAVVTYETEEEAIALANDTRYGLNAAVWGPKDHAIDVANQIEAGNVYINNSPRDITAPFGGWKHSGIGREGGIYGMIEFTQQRALFDTGD